MITKKLSDFQENGTGVRERIAGIRERIADIREQIGEAAAQAGRSPEDVTLMAVTKTVSTERVNEALSHGITLLGENRAQELAEKFSAYSCKKTEIHFIGHLQSNKIRDIINRVSCVESLDSVCLAEALQKSCAAHGFTMDVLLQVNIGEEIQKTGFSPEELTEAALQISALPNLRIRGLMAIQPVAASLSGGDRYFKRMEELRQNLTARNIPRACFSELSMGMSEDYTEAVRCGATIVRLGRAIFGPRLTSGFKE